MVAVLEGGPPDEPPEEEPEPEIPREPGICHLLMEIDRKARKPECGTAMLKVGRPGEQGKDWVYICPVCDPGYVEHSELFFEGAA